MYTIPTELEQTLLSYLKRTYLPEGVGNPKTAGEFTLKDIKFFARGAAQMSSYFTADRPHLPKNYFNKKELRSGYLLYFVMTNYLKARFCLEELTKNETDCPIKILDVGSGPGTAALACADHFRNSEQRVEITAVDQNTHSLHDAKHLFNAYSPKNVSLRTVYNNINPRRKIVNSHEKFNIIFISNFLSEIGNIDSQKIIVENILHHHLAENGAIIIIEPSLRWTSRNLMKLRDSLLSSQSHHLTIAPSHILSPCLHDHPCPMLASNNHDWCHMYLEWRRPEVIAEVDKLIGNRKDYIKFSYIIFGKASFAATPSSHHRTIAPSHHRTIASSHQFWRVVSAPMRSKGKIEVLLCNQSCKDRGLFRATRLDRDISPQNNDMDHVSRGDIISYSGGDRITKDAQFKIINETRS